MPMLVTARDKAECAQREVEQRRRVYARLMHEGKMSVQFATRQIEIMEAIAMDYQTQVEIEEAKGRLL
jgi:hypothetical protein